MGTEQPLLLVAMIVVSVVMAKWWFDDYRAAPPANPRALPGATPAPRGIILLAVAGSLVLLALETLGENALGLTEQQSRLTWLFGLYTLCAAIVEELIFRGYIVIANRGRAALILSIAGASLGFALLHPFLWTWKDGQLLFHFGEIKAWFSFGFVFAGSLWFYAVRFLPMNPHRSLLPCFAAHAAKNLGVIVIKYYQGFMGGWW